MNPNDASAHCEDNSSPDDPMDDWLFLSTDSAVRPGPEVSGENLETEDRGPLKTKLISVWNSVKYGPLLPL